MVADVLSTDPTSVLDGPTGATPSAAGPAPDARREGRRPDRLRLRAAARSPRSSQVVPLREGTGPADRDPDRVTVNYLGQVWGGREALRRLLRQGPATFSIGLGAVIKAWDQGLVGLKEGARVMLVCPPATGVRRRRPGPDIPARSTLVFVIDVLGVG